MTSFIADWILQNIAPILYLVRHIPFISYLALVKGLRHIHNLWRLNSHIFMCSKCFWISRMDPKNKVWISSNWKKMAYCIMSCNGVRSFNQTKWHKEHILMMSCWYSIQRKVLLSFIPFLTLLLFQNTEYKTVHATVATSCAKFIPLSWKQCEWCQNVISTEIKPCTVCDNLVKWFPATSLDLSCCSPMHSLFFKT